MATHSSVLALRIPGTGEPGGLPSLGSHRVRHDWSDLAAAESMARWPQCLRVQLQGKHWCDGYSLCRGLWSTHLPIQLIFEGFGGWYVCSVVWLFATPWNVAYKAPLPMEFSRQEYWRRVPFPSPGDPPNPGIKLTSLGLLPIQEWFFTTSISWRCYETEASSRASLGGSACSLSHRLSARFSLTSLTVGMTALSTAIQETILHSWVTALYLCAC